LIDVHVGNGRTRRAWTYVMSAETAGDRPIESGDWRAHRGRREEFIKALAAEHERTTPDMIAQLTNRLPFSFDPKSAANSLTPLWKALDQGVVSERKLAQESGRWVAVP
jgi:hypothetical protein